MGDASGGGRDDASAAADNGGFPSAILNRPSVFYRPLRHVAAMGMIPHRGGGGNIVLMVTPP